MGNFNNSNKQANNNNTCTKPDIYKVAEKAINSISDDIKKMAESCGMSKDEIVAKLIAKLNISVGDIDTRISDVPVFSNNVFNISIGDVTVAERGGRIKNKKKGGKKKNK